ncbi:MAG: hypothetical protein AAGG48_14640 [Planctomycetota bacterium]
MIETTLTNDELAGRLSELSDAVTKGKPAIDREFTMRVPAEPNRDADLVLAEAAKRLKTLADLDMTQSQLFSLQIWFSADDPRSYRESLNLGLREAADGWGLKASAVSRHETSATQQDFVVEMLTSLRNAKRELADLQTKHDRLHAKAKTAVESYDGNGEDWFNELMDDLGREIHGSE